MSWNGVHPETLAWAAGGLALALLILHLLRVRRRTVWVAHAPLWLALEREGKASALLRRLRRIWSLLLLLAIGGAVLSALGDPRPTDQSLLGFAPEEQPPVRHTMVLVDTSASMDTSDAGATRPSSPSKSGEEKCDRGGGAEGGQKIAHPGVERPLP